MSDAYPVKWPIEIGGPEIQKLQKFRKLRLVEVLPYIALQQSRVVGSRYRISISAVVRENPSSWCNEAVLGIGDTCNGPFFENQSMRRALVASI